MEAKVNALERRAEDFDRWRNTVDVKLAVNEEHNAQITATLDKLDKKQDKMISEVQRSRIEGEEGKTKLKMIYSGCLVLLGTLLHSIVGKLSVILIGGGKQ